MPLDPATTIAAALDAPERAKQPKKSKAARATKKSPKSVKAHRPARESTKTITNRLYSLWAQIVRGLAGNKCAVTGETGVLDAHHIIPRQVCSGLRFDPKNGILLSKSSHKFGKYSAHKGGIWFAEWLRQHDHEKYRYCLEHMDDELDCKNRARLYREEYALHADYEKFVGPLPSFRVTVVRRDGTKEVHERPAYNKKAAEYIVSLAGPSDNPIKGILKVEKIS